MRKGNLEMTFSSSNKPTEGRSTYRKNTSLQADLERIENPFRNLHAKIYYRQRKTSSKTTKDNNKEVKKDLKSSPLLTNMKNDQQTRLPDSPSLKVIEDYSVIDKQTTRKTFPNTAKNDQLKVDGGFDSNTYFNGQDKTTYLNQRNISVFKDSLSENDKVVFPLISKSSSQTLRRQEKAATILLTTSFVSSREVSQQEFLPRIRYASFHSLVYEDEKEKRRKWQKRVGDTQETRCEPQEREPFACLPCATAKEHRYQTENNVIPQRNHVSVSRRYRPILRSDTMTTKHNPKVHIEKVNASKNGDYNSGNHVNSPKNLSENNYIRKDVNGNFMALKAKLHR